jgi:hypothetical protein
VERDREEPSLAETLDERPVHVPNVLLEDVIEIAHRLVEVDAEDEAQRVQLIALREAEPPRHVVGGLSADAVELGLDVERDMEVLQIEQVGEIADRADRCTRLVVPRPRRLAAGRERRRWTGPRPGGPSSAVK